MRYDHTKTWLSSKSREPLRLRLMIPGMNRAADAGDILSAWIPEFGGLCCYETSIVRNVARGQATDDQSISFDPTIVKKRYSGLFNCFYVGVVHHPLVVTEGHKGWSEGSAGCQERQHVSLCLKRRSVTLRSGSIQHIAGDADEGRTAGAE